MFQFNVYFTFDPRSIACSPTLLSLCPYRPCCLAHLLLSAYPSFFLKIYLFYVFAILSACIPACQKEGIRFHYRWL